MLRVCRHKKERDPEGVSPSVKGLGVPDTENIDGDESLSLTIYKE